MDTPEVSLVTSLCGEYQALYVGEECVLQGPSLDIEEVCAVLAQHGMFDLNVEVIALPSCGRFPAALQDVDECM